MQEDSDRTARPPCNARYFLDAEVLQIAQRNDLALGGEGSCSTVSRTKLLSS